MNNNSAYLLVFHGSRNSQYFATISQLGDLFRQQIRFNLSLPTDNPPALTPATQPQSLAQVTEDFFPLVDVAVLEFAELPLADKIVSFAQKAIALDCSQLKIIPVFLSEGVHVQEDIPQELAQAQQKLNNQIGIQLLNCVGSYPQIIELVKQKFPAPNRSGKILLAHGSRRSQGNVFTEQLARKVNAINAYWTMETDLKSAVELLIKQDKSSLTIVPYFLFSGRITEAIANYVTELQAQYPRTKMTLRSPLGATPELAQVIAQLAS